jgi:sulfonate transport system substrate-binding protein
MRRFAKALGSVLFALCAVGAHAADAWPKTFVVGYQKYGTLIILKAHGDLERRLAPYGVEVKWAEFFAGAPILEAMNGGGVDFGITGETPPVFAQAAQHSVVRYVAYEPAAPAGEAILVPRDSPAKTIADLKGKTVGVARGSNAQYLLVRALQQAGLKWTDINVSYLSPADANAAFVQNRIDAWSIWDYYLAAAQKQSGARVLQSGEGLIDNYAFFLASERTLTEYPRVVQIALDEVAKVDAWARDHPEDAARLLAASVGIDAAILETALRRSGYGPRALTSEVVAAQQRIADTLVDIQLIPVRFAVRDAVWVGSPGVAAARTP